MHYRVGDGIPRAHSHLKLSFFITGSLAIPAPAIFLVPPYPSSQDDPIYISCIAPEDFLGANFTLYRGGEVVQLLQAPSARPDVTFNVTGGGSGDGRKAAGGNFRCQYGVMGEHSQPQMSDLSQPVQISFPGKTLQSLGHTAFAFPGMFSSKSKSTDK